MRWKVRRISVSEAPEKTTVVAYTDSRNACHRKDGKGKDWSHLSDRITQIDNSGEMHGLKNLHELEEMQNWPRLQPITGTESTTGSQPCKYCQTDSNSDRSN